MQNVFKIVCLCSCAATAVTAQSGIPDASIAQIDASLAAQVDFRDRAFSACYAQPVCGRNGVTLRAERMDEATGDWTAAKLYWDPIDGFGVLDGGQDDEVDPGERLLVTFDQPRAVSVIWYSDLFAKERKHYGRALSDDPADPIQISAATYDYEVVRATIYDQVESCTAIVTYGVTDLPEVEFNQLIDETVFETGGDLKKRWLLDSTDALVLADLGRENAGTTCGGVLASDGFAGGVVARNALSFDAPQDAEAEAFARLAEAETQEGTSLNPERLAALLEDFERLAMLAEASKLVRAIGDASNGEVPQELYGFDQVTAIELSAPTTTSNDFSVAGLVFGRN